MPNIGREVDVLPFAAEHQAVHVVVGACSVQFDPAVSTDQLSVQCNRKRIEVTVCLLSGIVRGDRGRMCIQPEGFDELDMGPFADRYFTDCAIAICTFVQRQIFHEDLGLAARFEKKQIPCKSG